MDSFKVAVLPSAEKEFLAVPFPFRRQINQRIVGLKHDPRPADRERLSEAEKYRLFVHGWFILYEIDDQSRLVTIWAALSS